MKPRLPTTVKIGAIDFAVLTHKRVLGKSTWGACSFALAKIKIKKGLPRQHQAVTLMHEIVHALLDSGGVGPELHDETFVEWFAEQLTDTLWNSPGLLTYLQNTKGIK